MTAKRELFSAVLLLVVFGLATASAARAAEIPNIYVIVVDGAGNNLGSSSDMPELWRSFATEKRGRFYRHGLACMPTVTNTNHVSIATGVYPVAHGIIGDSFWDRPRSRSEQMDEPFLIEVDTIFGRLHDAPGRVGAALFGKSKLAKLFGPLGGRTAANIIWGDRESEMQIGQPAPKPGSDERTIDQVIKTVTEQSPTYMLVNLGDVDRFSHAFTPESPEARSAVANVDQQLARLINFLRGLPSWNKTVVVITADHGIESTKATADAKAAKIDFEQDLRQHSVQGLAVVSDGGVASVYIDDGRSAPQALSLQQSELLKSARVVALGDPGIAEALYRLPNQSDGNLLHSLDQAHPDWRMSNPRIGELVVVARKGMVLAHDGDPRAVHGGPAERINSVAISGGYGGLKPWSIDDSTIVNAPDLGITARWLLGLPMPKFLSGQPVPADLCGRVLKEAFTP